MIGLFFEFGDDVIFKKVADVLANTEGAKIFYEGIADATVVEIEFVGGF